MQNEAHAWSFAGRWRRINDAGDPVAHRDDLAGCTATDLRRAMLAVQYEHGSGWGNQLVISASVDPDGDVEDDYVVEAVSFALMDGELVMELNHLQDHWPDDDDDDAIAAAISTDLAPILSRHRLCLRSAKMNGSRIRPPYQVDIEFGFNTRGRTLVGLLDAGLEAQALLSALHEGALSRESVADILHAGHASALIGQPEGPWLEVKGQHYDLSSNHGGISLAQAVARFCNAEAGGLVVVGLRTKRVHASDVIRAVTPMPLGAKTRHRYQQVLEHHLYPPPDHLDIAVIPHPPGELVLIDVPAQPEELKPFLVHGAIIDGKAEGAFISIVRRRGETSIPTTAPMIHSTLAAGRALLRRGHVPDSDAD